MIKKLQRERRSGSSFCQCSCLPKDSDGQSSKENKRKRRNKCSSSSSSSTTATMAPSFVPVVKEVLSVLMLCVPVFIFTSGSSALWACPPCGLSIWLSLVALFNTLFSVYAKFFMRKWTKHTQNWSLPFSHDRKMATDTKHKAQSTNIEGSSLMSISSSTSLQWVEVGEASKAHFAHPIVQMSAFWTS